MANDSVFTVHTGCDHIFFVGFMGAGKTTVARNLGELFKRRYVDTDLLISRRAKKSVARLYEEAGVEGYRKLETETLRHLKLQKSYLVSCGDGIVERPENIQLFRDMGKVVYLDISLDDALQQIQAKDHRPLLGSYAQTKRLYASRKPLYEAVADYTITIPRFEFAQVAYQIGELLWDEGLL